MIKGFLSIGVICFLTGCAGIGGYAVNVDSIAADDALNYTTYVIVPGYEATPGIEFDRYADQLEMALGAKGLTRVYDIKNATSVVLLGYQVGQAQTSTRTSSIPQWGQVGYSGSQTYGSVIGNQYSSTTTYTPKYGITGYQQVSNTVTMYPLAIYLLAATKDNTKKDGVREIWQATVTAGSTKPDLRSAFPAMLYAATPYIGGDTGGLKTIRVPRSLYKTP